MQHFQSFHISDIMQHLYKYNVVTSTKAREHLPTLLVVVSHVLVCVRTELRAPATSTGISIQMLTNTTTNSRGLPYLDMQYYSKKNYRVNTCIVERLSSLGFFFLVK